METEKTLFQQLGARRQPIAWIDGAWIDIFRQKGVIDGDELFIEAATHHLNHF